MCRRHREKELCRGRRRVVFWRRSVAGSMHVGNARREEGGHYVGSAAGH